MSTFQFQQFSVRQQRSAMKVCTDATLFGAMMPIQPGDRVLDIGTGNGLLALMAAQLGAETVSAIELTAEACIEARHNATTSPWQDKIDIVEQDIQSYAVGQTRRYDLIIANPPFYSDHTRAADQLRSIARHTDRLPYPDLIGVIEQLLTAHGIGYLLLPLHALQTIRQLANAKGLHLIRQTDYRGFEHSKAKVCAVTFSRQPTALQQEQLTIYQSPREYTQRCADYLAPFLLRFADKTATASG